MKKYILALLSAALISSVFANDQVPTDTSDWYISPLGSYIKSDKSRLTDDNGYNFHMGLGKELSDRFNLELGLDVNRFDRTNLNQLEQIGLELDALYFFNRESPFSPYIATGIGMFNTNETDDTNTSWSAGLGLLSNVGFFEDAKLRTEVRFQQEYDSSNYVHDDVLLRAGVQIPFGASTIAPKLPPKDSDNDGVNDDADKCPTTPAGTKVNSYGCELDTDKDGIVDSIDLCPDTPAGSIIDSAGCQIIVDTDADGVPDDSDNCPNTQKGASVNVNGCTLDGDDDLDGIANSQDQCPDSASGVRIDFKGCEIKTVISLPGIRFETNSAQLTHDSAITLDGAAMTLNTYPDIKAEVAGHTDSKGSNSYNTSLSERRAASVREYLIGKGVTATRLTSKGYGETQPIASNDTTEGRATNRRVNLNLIQ